MAPFFLKGYLFMRKPHKVDLSVDSNIDLESLVQEIATQAVSAYLVIKGFKTLCSAFEHIVVAKVN